MSHERLSKVAAQCSVLLQSSRQHQLEGGLGQDLLSSRPLAPAAQQQAMESTCKGLLYFCKCQSKRLEVVKNSRFRMDARSDQELHESRSH